jgi:hypothetical protein
MWDISAPRKRFYRRPWFLVPFCLFVAVGLVGLVYVLGERGKLQAKAATFDYSRLEAMESASVIYDRNGVVMGRMFTQNRDQVKIDQLSPALLKAVVAAEDAEELQVRQKGAGSEHAGPAARAQYFPRHASAAGKELRAQAAGAGGGAGDRETLHQAEDP